MDRYKNAKIYKIIDNITGAIYIGSTCEPTLARRLAKHKYDYKKYLNDNMNFVTSFKIIENNNYNIILLEEYPCETKDQLLARERYHIETSKCVNKVIPSRTKQEWYNENKDIILDKCKEYYNQNKNEINECRKQYVKKNQDKIKKYKKEYYNENKDKINEKFDCECGGKFTSKHKFIHLKTIKHQKYLETLNNNLADNL
jgi:hypothetical protein